MGGGCLPTGGQGSKVYVLCAEPKEHKRFRPGARPGGIGFPAGRIGDRGDREIVYVPNVYRHIRIFYLSNSKTFQDGNGNGNFGKINSNDFQDGNWESMEMKG